jgi:uncharacterized protein
VGMLMSQLMLGTAATIAQELNVNVAQVEVAIQLINEGATVPFIARYRKEATGGLNDVQLRMLDERLHYLQELEERRQVVLQSIREQEKLTPQLESSILAADTKTRLEDLYLPFRPKRRTKAQLAREAGLEPLAMALLQNPSLAPQEEAKKYINSEKDVANEQVALEGAQQILMELFSEDADLLSDLRSYLEKHCVLKSTIAKNAKSEGNKFSDYFAYEEPLRKIPSHRALALFRGRRENAITFMLTLPENPEYGELRIAAYFNIVNEGRAADNWLAATIKLTWKTKLFTKLELELLAQLREMADDEAIKVFASNLRDLLLAAPAGQKITIGLDPGLRTGVKVVVVDVTGKLLDYTVIFPHAPQNEWHPSIAALAKFAAKYHVNLISIGNGTASRETERLVADLIKMYPDLKLTKVLVSEAGASVYSASELASQEFPDIDVTIRGAISIARRLQDPLAELVKIEPKSIGVGQYQHDVNQSRLARTLEGVVEDCVNAVGVDINTASQALLTHVAGLNDTLAKNLVQHRDQNGPFKSREQLKEVARMGEKTFQQAAGFLRIVAGDNPLDASAVHPEAYPLVERILTDKQLTMDQIIGNRELLQAINPKQYINDDYGLPTIQDILKELEKPGRDPRPEFKTVTFKEGVEDISHLEIGMILDGVVSNVTNFGAFVDIGVHQDGLVHISAMTNKFITDPRSIVKAGDIVKIKVTEVDKERRRIGLSMRLDGEKPVGQKKQQDNKAKVQPIKKPAPRKQEVKKPAASKTVFNTSMADALSKLKKGK